MGNDYYWTNEHHIDSKGRISNSGEIFGYYVITHQYYRRYRLPVMHTETNRKALHGFFVSIFNQMKRDKPVKKPFVRKSIGDFDINVYPRYDKRATTPMLGLVLKPRPGLSLYANLIEGLSRGDVIPATAALGNRRRAWSQVAAIGPHVRAIEIGDRVLVNRVVYHLRDVARRDVIDDVGHVLHVVGPLGRDRHVPAVALCTGLQRRDEHALRKCRICLPCQSVGAGDGCVPCALRDCAGSQAGDSDCDQNGFHPCLQLVSSDFLSLVGRRCRA